MDAVTLNTIMREIKVDRGGAAYFEPALDKILGLIKHYNEGTFAVLFMSDGAPSDPVGKGAISHSAKLRTQTQIIPICRAIGEKLGSRVSFFFFAFLSFFFPLPSFPLLPSPFPLLSFLLLDFIIFLPSAFTSF